MTSPPDPARWALIAPHRDYLLRLARRRTPTEQDAEDCVHEAMLRCAQFDGLDESRVVALLTSVTTRLCVDLHRTRSAQDRAAHRLAGEPAVAPSHEDAVCDQAEAVWVAGLAGSLPRRQRDAVAARAATDSGAEAAHLLGLSYKSIEAALGRARHTVRTAWRGALIWLGASRLRRGTAVAFVAAASVVTFGLGVRTLDAHRPPGGERDVAEPVRPVAGDRDGATGPLPRLTSSPYPEPVPGPTGPEPPKRPWPSCQVGVGSACAGTTDPTPTDLVTRVSDYVDFVAYCVSHGPSVRPSPLYFRCPSYPPREGDR